MLMGLYAVIILMVLSAAAGAVGGYWFCNRKIARLLADKAKTELDKVK